MNRFFWDFDGINGMICEPGSYWDGLVCTACDSDCRTCYGGASDECFSCYFTGKYLFFENQS